MANRTANLVVVVFGLVGCSMQAAPLPLALEEAVDGGAADVDATLPYDPEPEADAGMVQMRAVQQDAAIPQADAAPQADATVPVADCTEPAPEPQGIACADPQSTCTYAGGWLCMGGAPAHACPCGAGETCSAGRCFAVCRPAPHCQEGQVRSCCHPDPGPYPVAHGPFTQYCNSAGQWEGCRASSYSAQ